MNIKNLVCTWPQYALPHHALSSLMAKLTHSENQLWKNLFIRQIIKHYRVNMEEALEQDLNAYKNFNAFFTRELKPGIRSINSEPDAIVSPADGAISQIGSIAEGEIFQAKGRTFTASELLGDDRRAEHFKNGVFATIYLSPKDYHRLHMPITGRLTEMVHIPGRLFSVNAATTNTVPRLFARNERVVALFDTDLGPMALVLVGAIFVSSIETVWHGVVTPPTINEPRTWQYRDQTLTLNQGEEMGRFNMGSTIIVLFGNNMVEWTPSFIAGTSIRLGELLGRKILNH